MNAHTTDVAGPQAVEARTVGGLAGKPAGGGRLFQLDGWRGISILLVLACHLLPLGPHAWNLNAEAGLVGMCLFFTLSGYLITSFLLRRPQVRPFLIRRLVRIVPLAWMFVVVVFLIEQAPLGQYPSSLFFYLNYHLQDIQPYDSHFWSLCVEMQFYLFVALVVAVGGRRGLYILPLVCIAVTANRAWTSSTVSIVTLYRVDEILAGATLALIHVGKLPEALAWPMRRGGPWVWLVALAVCANPNAPLVLQYLRPYAAAGLVGATLYQPHSPLVRHLGNRVLKYFATISYALYVIHGPLRTGWFAQGSHGVLYLIKRPITITLSIVLAHLSTFYWEAPWIALGKRLTRRPAAAPQASDTTETRAETPRETAT